MRVRRTIQSLLAVALCLVLAADLGSFYLVPVAAVTLIAVSTGMLITLALAAGLVWPVLVVAYVLHVTRDARLRAQATHHAARGSVAGEPGLPRVEDP